MITCNFEIECSCGNKFSTTICAGDTTSSIGLPIYVKRMNCNKCKRYHEVEFFRTIDGYKINHEETDVMLHKLKILPGWYEDVVSGLKKFELRKNDRNYQVGDYIELNEFEPNSKTYTGRKCTRKITYIFTGYMIADGYIILGIEKESNSPTWGDW